MEYNRFTNTLAEVPARIVEIKEVGVPMKEPVPHVAEGFQLCDGYAVLDLELDENNFYIGQYGVDGIYHPTSNRYEPIYDDDFFITAFRQMEPHVILFSPDQQTLIAQYTLNTKENLILDLSELLKKPLMFEMHELIRDTINLLSRLSEEPCRQLMADLYWTYRERSLQSIQEEIIKRVGTASQEN